MPAIGNNQFGALIVNGARVTFENNITRTASS
jgi:hypothetical protein